MQFTILIPFNKLIMYPIERHMGADRTKYAGYSLINNIHFVSKFTTLFYDIQI